MPARLMLLFVCTVFHHPKPVVPVINSNHAIQKVGVSSNSHNTFFCEKLLKVFPRVGIYVSLGQVIIAQRHWHINRCSEYVVVLSPTGYFNRTDRLSLYPGFFDWQCPAWRLPQGTLPGKARRRCRTPPSTRHPDQIDC